MAIRKINSRSIQDGQIATADLADDAITAGKIADSVTLGVGFFQGENTSGKLREPWEPGKNCGNPGTRNLRIRQPTEIGGGLSASLSISERTPSVQAVIGE